MKRALTDLEMEKAAIKKSGSGTDLLIANDFEYTEERLTHHREEVKRYETVMRKLIRKALSRNWSLKRVAVFSGIAKPREWLDHK